MTKTADSEDSYQHNQMPAFGQPGHSEQHLIIQPIEFDHKHKNMYGYLALLSAILLIISYLLIKERTCQISIVNGSHTYDLIQSFHMISLIVSIIVFVLSYFNFALVLSEFKIVFYATALLIYLCAFLLVYNTVAITSWPCVPLPTPTLSGGTQGVANGILQMFDAQSVLEENRTIFTAGDTIGIVVFSLDLLAACTMFLAGRRFYKKC